MVYQSICRKRKKEFAHEAESLRSELVDILQLKSVEQVRVVNRYDVEGCSKEILMERLTQYSQSLRLILRQASYAMVKTRAYLQQNFSQDNFDQRANSASECIQITSKGERPLVRSAKVYIIKGKLSETDLDKIKSYVINPVESRLASMDEFETLKVVYEIPTEVEVLDGFIDMNRNDLMDFIRQNGLAMDIADLEMCRKYFESEKRNPTVTEIKVIDT